MAKPATPEVRPPRNVASRKRRRAPVVMTLPYQRRGGNRNGWLPSTGEAALSGRAVL
jgi:hypothetical protein